MLRFARHRQPPRFPEPLEHRRLLAAAPPTTDEGVWQVLGGRRGDVITVDVSPDDATSLRATVNGAVVGTRPAASVRRVDVLAGAGNDQVTISLDGRAGAVAVRVDGGRGRDRIAGGDADEELDGGPGADLITGGGGKDRLLGGPGNDDLTGGAGADRISGGRGRDRVHRQGGVDTVPREKRDVVGRDGSAATLTRLATDEALRQWLVGAAVRQYAWAFGQPAWGWNWRVLEDGTVFTAFAAAGAGGGGVDTDGGAPAAPSAGGGAIGEGFSRTNVQENGVDEADLVETDGQFIYTLRPAPYVPQPPPLDGGGGASSMPAYLPLNAQLVIADADPANAMSVSSRTTIDGTSLGMYLVGNRLAVVTQSYPVYPMLDVALGVPVRFAGGALGSTIVDPGDPTVKVTVFDVSDRAAPRVVEETTLEGGYAGSRAVGDRVYVILSNNTWAPAPDTLDDGKGGKVYESEASYRQRLESKPLADLLPQYTAKTGGGAESTGALVAAPDVYVKDVDAPVCGQNMTTVAVLNVGDDAAGPSGTTSVAGWAGTTYASPTSLYLASEFFEPGETDAEPGQTHTNLFRFELGPDAVPLAATGEVEGGVVNQFSMDEEGTDFRIATTKLERGDDPAAPPATTAPPPIPTTSNGVYVLRQDGDELKVVGSVTKLGLTERIQSARFVGDMAYLVTFRRTDPLFAIDLRDPTHPRVAGELKIPGFSSYLQPIGDGLLIGIGRDADETGRARGLQLSLFDVSNPAKPVRLAAHSFGDENAWQWSEAEHNHLAVSYFPEQHVLAIPVFRSGGGLIGLPMPGVPATRPEERPYALELFRVGREEGIDALGAVTSDEPILRSLRIGTAVFAVETNVILAAAIDSPETLVGALSLRGPDEPEPG